MLSSMWIESLYTMGRKKCVTLFWTMAAMFLGGFLHFLYQWKQEWILYIVKKTAHLNRRLILLLSNKILWRLTSKCAILCGFSFVRYWLMSIGWVAHRCSACGYSNRYSNSVVAGCSAATTHKHQRALVAGRHFFIHDRRKCENAEMSRRGNCAEDPGDEGTLHVMHQSVCQLHMHDDVVLSIFCLACGLLTINDVLFFR